MIPCLRQYSSLFNSTVMYGKYPDHFLESQSIVNTNVYCVVCLLIVWFGPYSIGWRHRQVDNARPPSKQVRVKGHGLVLGITASQMSR